MSNFYTLVEERFKNFATLNNLEFEIKDRIYPLGTKREYYLNKKETTLLKMTISKSASVSVINKRIAIAVHLQTHEDSSAIVKKTSRLSRLLHFRNQSKYFTISGSHNLKVINFLSNNPTRLFWTIPSSVVVEQLPGILSINLTAFYLDGMIDIVNYLLDLIELYLPVR